MKLPEHVREAINLRQPKRQTWFEDVEIKYDGRSTYISLLAEHRLDADGNRVIEKVTHHGRPVTLPETVVQMLEEALEEDDEHD